MKYVLIIMMVYPVRGGVSVTTQEFTDEMLCKVAQTSVIVQKPEHTEVKAFCVGKGF